MSIKHQPEIELHSVKCACGGTRWLGYPGIGPRAHDCLEPEGSVIITSDEWFLLGKPRTTEQWIVAALCAHRGYGRSLAVCGACRRPLWKASATRDGKPTCVGYEPCSCRPNAPVEYLREPEDPADVI